MNELTDSYNRKIDYLRISVTDRCNLGCSYCQGKKDFDFKKHSEILSYEEILFFTAAAVEAGISRIRLTGGEPLVRRDVVGLIERILQLPGVEDVSLTTNGVFLSKMAEELYSAGLRRINISLDSLNPKTYSEITGGGDLSQVLEGIQKALELGMEPVKINAVSVSSVLDELDYFVQMATEYPIHVRFIEYMQICQGRTAEYVDGLEIKNKLEQAYKLQPASSPKGFGPAEYYRIPGALGSIGFIFPYSKHFCPSCNRLRLTADGHLRTCLFSEREIDVIGLMRKKVPKEELVKVIKQAMFEKPENMHEASRKGPGRNMRQIGG